MSVTADDVKRMGLCQCDSCTDPNTPADGPWSHAKEVATKVNALLAEKDAEIARLKTALLSGAS